MVKSLLGIKLGQTQTFTDQGERIPVTAIKAGPCLVVQVKGEKDGYLALQLGFEAGKEKRTTRSVLGHLQKAGIKTIPRFFREVEVLEDEALKVGEEIKVGDVFQVGDIVNVTGISKGKGFAGVVKRWGFAGGPKTHGQSDRHRAPGSIGQRTTPGRVHKGKHMAGRMGGKTKTTTGLSIYKIDQEKNELWIRGLVPGCKGELIKISKQI